MPPTSFLFVDGTKTDRETRRRARSHAMRGKNAGRTLNRPSRRKLTAAESVQKQTQLAGIPRIPRIGFAAGHFLRTLQLPVEISDTALAVIHLYTTCVTDRLYPSRLGLDSRPYWADWLQMLLSDSATLHCGLALMEACNELLCGTSLGSRMSPEGLHHVNMALHLVNERLTDRAAAVSDTTVGIIIMLIIREQICQQGAVADVHFRGLLRIVELRGGLEEMEASSRRLVLKICKLDVSSAWQFGRPLHFYRNRLAAVLQEMAALRLSPRYQEAGPELPAQELSGSSDTCPWEGLVQPELARILREARRISCLLNAAPRIGQLVHIETYHEITVSLGCRLLRIDPTSSEVANARASHFDRTIHLGLTLFTMILYLQTDRQRGFKYPLIVQRLERMLADFMDEDDSSRLVLRMWLLLFGAIWLAGDDTLDDILQRILEQLHTTALQLNLQDWTRVCQSLVIHRLPWIQSLHGDMGKKIWQRVCG